MIHNIFYNRRNIKLLQSIIYAFMLVFSSLSVLAQGSITGTIVYANTALSAIHDSTLVRVYQGTALIQEIPVNSDGSFTFIALTEGSYTVKAIVNKFPGGFNAMDSYYVLRHFCGFQPQLTGIYKIAADVNGSGGTPASDDELAILRRYLHKIKTFYNPLNPNTLRDWVSENVNVGVVSNITNTITLHVLCTGDVDGSFIPY